MSDVALLLALLSVRLGWADNDGESKNQRSIADDTGLGISRLLPLAFLSLDLMEAILEGMHSSHLSLKSFPGKLPADLRNQWASLRNSEVQDVEIKPAQRLDGDVATLLCIADLDAFGVAAASRATLCVLA